MWICETHVRIWAMSLLFDLKHIRKCVWIWLQMSTFEVLTSNVHIWSSDFKCPHLKSNSHAYRSVLQIDNCIHFWSRIRFARIHAFANVYGDMWDTFANVKCQITTRFEVRHAFTRSQICMVLCETHSQMWNISLLLDLKSDSHAFANLRYQLTTRFEVRFTRVVKFEIPAYYSIWSEIRIHAFANASQNTFANAWMRVNLISDVGMWDTFANAGYQLSTRFEVRFTRVRKMCMVICETRSHMWNASLLLDLKLVSHTFAKGVWCCVRHIRTCGMPVYYSIWS